MKNEKDDFLKEFGIKVKQLRQMMGYTQKELAEMCGYTSESSNSTINKIETGKSDISITKLMKIAEVFDVAPSYLIGDEGSEDVAENVSMQNAMRIMQKRLSENEQAELLNGLEVYFARRQTTEAL